MTISPDQLAAWKAAILYVQNSAPQTGIEDVSLDFIAEIERLQAISAKHERLVGIMRECRDDPERHHLDDESHEVTVVLAESDWETLLEACE